MGYRLCDPEKRKIVRSNDVIFREDRMHKQPVKTEEVRRVVFRKDVPFRQPSVPSKHQHLPAINDLENAGNGAGNDEQDVAQDAPQLQHENMQLGQPAGAGQHAEISGQQAENAGLQVPQPANGEPLLRRSTRPSRPPERFVPGEQYAADYVMLSDCGEPSCFQEAMTKRDSKKWFKAMLLEMESLEKNDTWDLE